MAKKNLTNGQQLIVDQDAVPQRIDNFLFTYYKDVPKGRIYRGLRTGQIRVNGRKIQPTCRVQAGDIIDLPVLQTTTRCKPRSKINLVLLRKVKQAIIYENEQLIIINKPAGLAVHGGSGVNNGLIELLRAWRENPKLALCHRIDKETSGCLIVAKKPIVLNKIHELFRQKLINKMYLALVAGHWPKRLAKIDSPLVKQRLASGERVAKASEEGKPAVTLVRVLKTGANCSLLEVRPRTGRMHQIRVHLAQAGYPIIGDRKYGNRTGTRPKRLFLHAAALQFKDNFLDEEINLCACLDSDFLKEIAAMLDRE